ncbi:MAG: hypothetical protein HZA61_11680 [Candidatus Eisenbacteria bacterium]|uniref:Dual OB-containing domain-containing protein n=1 Tax=Eiseniibacteriota bacterium TaxID=2212470 RepID=A0A933W923_UNCEI|nr:hypothetical protein [Candidatus Eisenbacteria bacterium]
MSLQGKTVTLVCLANSWKHHERCVAGKIWGGEWGGQWVRPVGAAPTGELTLRERSIEGRDPKLLDLIEVKLGSAAPHSCHREDYRVVAGVPWVSRGRAGVQEVAAMCDPVDSLWVNGIHPQNDRMPKALADAQPASLRLIRVEQPIWSWRMFADKPKPRLVFTHAGDRYDLSVTDPEAVRLEPAHAEPRTLEGSYLLCISVGEPFHDEMYKLVAGMLRLPEEGR